MTHSERKLATSMFKRLPALVSGADSGKGAPGLRNGIRAQNSTSKMATVKTFIPGAPLYSNAADKENASSVDGGGGPAGGTRDASSMPPPPSVPVQTGTKRPGKYCLKCVF